MKESPVKGPDRAAVSPCKLVCQLIGTDGNVFSIIGRVRGTLRQAGMTEKAQEFADRAFKAESYDAVLQLCMEYVEVS
ncbi:hypothetical protein ACFL4W_01510 [Planctomycetota bacterium]